MTRRELIAALDRAHGQALWLRERGRCFVCGLPGGDAAHLIGRRHLATRWDLHEAGNVHFLCRSCHAADHHGRLLPSYRESFIERNNQEAYNHLMQRASAVDPLPDCVLEEKLEAMRGDRDQ